MNHNDLVPMIGTLLRLDHEPVTAVPPSNPDVDVNWQADGRWFRLRVWPEGTGVIAMSETSDDGEGWTNGQSVRVHGREAVRIMKEISARAG